MNRNAAFFSLSLFLSGVSVASANAPIGYVKTTEGTVTIVSAGQASPARPGRAVLARDTLITGDDSSVGVTFRDQSRASLGENSELELKTFEFEPVQQKYSFITRMVRGTLFYVSGLISKLSPGSASVETPVATIGIRDTRFLLSVDDE